MFTRIINIIESINNKTIALITILSVFMSILYFFYKVYSVTHDHRIARGRVVFSRTQPIREITYDNKGQIFEKNKYNNILIVENEEGELLVQIDNVKR